MIKTGDGRSFFFKLDSDIPLYTPSPSSFYSLSVQYPNSLPRLNNNPQSHSPALDVTSKSLQKPDDTGGGGGGGGGGVTGGGGTGGVGGGGAAGSFLPNI